MSLEGIERLIKGLESQQSWQVQKQFSLILLHWPKAVGAAVARKTRPISIQRETLYVATATASWAQTLSYERVNILRKLNRYQKQPLKAIRFSTAQWMQQKQSINRRATSHLAESDIDINELNASATEVPERLMNHPSYIGRVPHLAEQADLTPESAFQRWSVALREMQRTQAVCPTCQCRCPQGEINRWSHCGHCAAKSW